MSNFYDMLALLALGVGIGAWMKLSTTRERAVHAARVLCERHGLQLLDETVGLHRVRVLRLPGRLQLERCYGFDVSTDGHDREPGKLWMVGNSVVHASLPSRETLPPGGEAEPAAHAPADSNVIVLATRRRGFTGPH